MNMFIIDKEIYIRLGFFFGVFAFMALMETISPRRPLSQSKSVRWLNNLSITFLDSALLRLVLPLTAVEVAVYCRDHGLGLFNMAAAPEWIAGALSIGALDLTIYAQHALFHRAPIFWRLHRMHHTDLDIDVTTGSRFHPIEILISMFIKMAAITLLGTPVWSVVVFEVLLNATSMFNHSNVLLNKRLDAILRMFMVTPDMHRVHHSVIIKETNSNYGFNLSWWDRLFGTYRAQPVAGHDGMTIGLANYRDKKWLTMPWMLVVPFSNNYR